MALIYIALGGAAGALARYGLSGWVYHRFDASLYWGTLVVNLVGSLVLGFAIAWFDGTAVPIEVRRAVIIGFLGAFTTFSTFAYESVVLMQDGQWVRAGGYALGSLVLGMAAVLIGLALGASLLKPRG